VKGFEEECCLFGGLKSSEGFCNGAPCSGTEAEKHVVKLFRGLTAVDRLDDWITGCLMPGAWCLLPLSWCLMPLSWCLLPGAWYLMKGYFYVGCGVELAEDSVQDVGN